MIINHMHVETSSVGTMFLDIVVAFLMIAVYFCTCYLIVIFHLVLPDIPSKTNHAVKCQKPNAILVMY